MQEFPATAATLIHIVSAADSSFALPLAVMIRSVCSHLAPEEPAIFWILDGGLSRKQRRAVEDSLTAEAQSIRWLEVPRDQVRRFETDRTSPAANYFRLLIGDLLPKEVTRALYLDADTLALENIRALWEQNLLGNCLGAVPEPDPSLDSSTHASTTSETRSLNAGVLLIDVEHWRNDSIGQRLIEQLATPGKDRQKQIHVVFNTLLRDQWTTLPLRWNQIVSPGLRHNELDQSQSSELRPSVGIAHFAKQHKPWNSFNSHPAVRLFHEYQREIRWSRRFTWQSAASLLTRPDVATVIVTIALSQLGNDYFPFSKFPMYSSFPPKATYYFISDSNDEPYSGDKDLNLRMSHLKKYIEARAYRLQAQNPRIPFPELQQQAATEFLKEFAEGSITPHHLPPKSDLKLWLATLHSTDSKIAISHEVLAQWKVPS